MVDRAARASASAALEARVEHEVIVEAAELQAVLVAAAADIVDVQVAEDEEAACVHIGIVAAVVGVDAVRGGVAHLEIVDDHIARSNQVHRVAAALDHGSRLTRRAADPDRSRRRAGEAVAEGASCVGAGVDADRGAGVRERESSVDGTDGASGGPVVRVVAGRGHVELAARRAPALEGGDRAASASPSTTTRSSGAGRSGAARRSAGATHCCARAAAHCCARAAAHCCARAAAHCRARCAARCRARGTARRSACAAASRRCSGAAPARGSRTAPARSARIRSCVSGATTGATRRSRATLACAGVAALTVGQVSIGATPGHARRHDEPNPQRSLQHPSLQRLILAAIASRNQPAMAGRSVIDDALNGVEDCSAVAAGENGRVELALDRNADLRFRFWIETPFVQDLTKSCSDYGRVEREQVVTS